LPLPFSFFSFKAVNQCAACFLHVVVVRRLAKPSPFHSAFPFQQLSPLRSSVPQLSMAPSSRPANLDPKAI